MPSPMNMQAKRCGGRVLGFVNSPPHKWAASSHGSETDSPKPLSSTRRERVFGFTV